MAPLIDVQRIVRHAVVRGDLDAARPILVGGADPVKRLAIHHRHYRASLVRTLLDRFPALVWLLGSGPVTDAAASYVAEHPPVVPSLSEFGRAFPAYLAARPERRALGYVAVFGELEWHVGAVSIAVDGPALGLESIAACAPSPDAASLALQPGTRYVHAAWPVQELMRFFLTESAPDRYELRREDTWIEVRGARGEFQINALDAGAWTFRSDLQAGGSIAHAAAAATDVDSAFDAGRALAQLAAGGLVAAIHAVD